MYNCQNCGTRVLFATKQEIKRASDLKTKPSKPVRAMKVILEKRPKTYKNEIILDKRKDKKKIVRTQGWEIVREIKVCKKCYIGFDNLSKKNDEIQCV